jgi:hypothetical protein
MLLPLNYIVTGDDKWIYPYELEGTEYGRRYLIFVQKEIFNFQPVAGTVILTLFWDSQGPVPQHYQERGVTLNSAHSSIMLHVKPRQTT